jgi:parallel beta-helix repeat protein
VSNSAIYNGHGKGIVVSNSQNILLENNAIFSFYKFGIQIVTSDKITINGNILVDVRIRDVIALDHMVDISGGIIACGADKEDVCTQIYIENNIVAGTFFSGYVAYGHNCGDYSEPYFRNNIAHSIEGTGAVIF